MINRLIAALFLVTLLGASITVAGSKINVDSDSGLAIEGYDPVAYFRFDEPVRGVAAISAEYAGATWAFATTGNRQLFLQDPEKYLPQYGGFCAYAAAHSAYAEIDPIAFTIHDDKLYLNYSPRVKRKWESNVDEFITRGDSFWGSEN